MAKRDYRPDTPSPFHSRVDKADRLRTTLSQLKKQVNHVREMCETLAKATEGMSQKKYSRLMREQATLSGGTEAYDLCQAIMRVCLPYVVSAVLDGAVERNSACLTAFVRLLDADSVAQAGRRFDVNELRDVTDEELMEQVKKLRALTMEVSDEGDDNQPAQQPAPRRIGESVRRRLGEPAVGPPGAEGNGRR